MNKVSRWMFGGSLGASLVLLALSACGPSAQGPARVPFTEVLDCTGMDDVSAMFPISHTVEDGGHTIRMAARLGTFGPDSGTAFATDTSARLRAAAVCACRARRNRQIANKDEHVGDTLTVIGGVGTIGGGIVNGVAATGVDDTTRKTLLTSGIISMGVGALAFGANAALGFNKRATTVEAAARDQEYAAAVLWNDSAGQDQWSRAWYACVAAEGSDTLDRAQNPAGAFESDGGGSSDSSQTSGGEASAPRTGGSDAAPPSG